MSKRKPIRFRGWDWTELLQLKNIATKWPKVPKDLDGGSMTLEDNRAAYCITEYLGSLIMCDERKAEAKQAAKYVRRFCAALGKCKYDYSAPVYAAMAKIENDDVLFRWVQTNLESMWN